MSLFFALTLVCAFLAGVTVGAWLNEPITPPNPKFF
jgi:hypothetical protein